MSTAGDIIQTALKRVLVQASDAPLEPDEYQDALDSLNDLMAAYEADGIRLGYTPVDNVEDEVTVPPGARRGIIANLAIEISADYGGNITAALSRQASEGMQTLRKLGRAAINSVLPDTLPAGSGNDNCYGYGSAYFAEVSTAMLTLSGNALETVFTATDTPVRVNGFWRGEASNWLRADITGTVVSTALGDIDADVRITLSATGNSTCTFRIMKNGVSQQSASAALTASPATVTLAKLVTLSLGDYVELWVEDDLATEAVVVASARFEVA